MEKTNAAMTISREDLYRRLWEMPATKIAREFGISDVAMLYLCRDYNIPKPPKGYWSLVEHGAAPERPPLPPLTDSAKHSVEIMASSITQVVRRAASRANGALGARGVDSAIRCHSRG